jgi:MFS family permease
VHCVREEQTLDKQPERKRQKKGAWRTVWAMGAAQSVDACEGNIVSALFPSIGQSLGLNVGHLGTILSANQILGLISRPIWSMLADRYSRKAVLLWVTGMWGIWTLLVGFAADYRQVLLLTILSGIGLAAREGPSGSLIADQFPEEDRGKAFGTIWAIASVGAILGILIFGPLAEISELGWRIAYWFFGGLSVLSGVLIWLLVDEPVRGQSEAALADVTDEVAERLEARHPFEFKKIPALFKIPALLVGWLGYIPGQFLWVGMVRFGVTWLADERGLSHAVATLALGTLTVGLGIGGLLGGRIGDWADRRNPRIGRIIVGHVAQAMAVIASYLLFQIGWGSYVVYWAFFLILGLSIQVAGSGASAAMESAVVLPEIRATSSAVGGTIAAVAGAAVAYAIGQLGASMGLTSVLSWTVTGACAALTLIWFAYYPTYHKDAARMQQTLTERRAALTADT